MSRRDKPFAKTLHSRGRKPNPCFTIKLLSSMPARAYRLSLGLRNVFAAGQRDWITKEGLSRSDYAELKNAYGQRLPEPQLSELPGVPDGDQVLAHHREDLRKPISDASVNTFVNLFQGAYAPGITPHVLSPLYTLAQVAFEMTKADPDDRAKRDILTSLATGIPLTRKQLGKLVHVGVFGFAKDRALTLRRQNDRDFLAGLPYPRRLTHSEIDNLRSTCGNIGARAELMALVTHPEHYGMLEERDKATTMLRFAILAYRKDWRRPDSAPGPACIYPGPSAGDDSKEEAGVRLAERIQHVPVASPSEKDPAAAPATQLRRSQRIVPPVRYSEDESNDHAWHLSRFLELYAQIPVRPRNSPGKKRLKRASDSNDKASSSERTQRLAIGAAASTLNEEPSDDGLEMAWNDYESDSADSWKTQEFVTLSFKESSEKTSEKKKGAEDKMIN